MPQASLVSSSFHDASFWLHNLLLLSASMNQWTPVIALLIWWSLASLEDYYAPSLLAWVPIQGLL